MTNLNIAYRLSWKIEKMDRYLKYQVFLLISIRTKPSHGVAEDCCRILARKLTFPQKGKIIKIKFKFKYAGQRAEVEIPGTDFGPRYSGIYTASSEQTKNGNKFKKIHTFAFDTKSFFYKKN